MIEKKQNCTGCYACYTICPRSCIIMDTDKEGFGYPKVNEQRCIDCHLCEKGCPVLKPIAEPAKKDLPISFAACSRNNAVRMQSSSGGIFSELAQAILGQGGVVFGAAFQDDFSVSHICVESVDELGKLRGSKYLQSRIGSTYKQAKNFLEKGRLVYFSGTPCQIEGLLSYLGKEYDNLYTQDLICHGVPSPMVWEKYVKHREKEAASKAQKVSFRHKEDSWQKYFVRFDFKDGTSYIRDHSEDLYITGFLRDLSLRPSCYDCRFKTINRHADITLADFWGIEKICPEMNDDKGTSLVLIHSQKGKKLWNMISDQIVYRSVETEQAIKYNTAAVQSVNEPHNRDAFMKAIRRGNFEKTVRKFTTKKKRSFSFRCTLKKALRKIFGNKTIDAIKRKPGR